MLPLLAELIGPLLVGVGVRAIAGMTARPLITGAVKGLESNAMGGIAEEAIGHATTATKAAPPQSAFRTSPMLAQLVQSAIAPRNNQKSGVIGNLLQSFNFRNQSSQSEPTGRGFASVAAHSRNFGALLSGATTPERVRSQADNEHAEQESDDARKKATKSLVGLTGAATGVAVGLHKLPDAFAGFGRSLLSGQEVLRQFNGQIDQAFAGLERTRTKLAYQSGEATAGTTSVLAKSLGRFEEDSAEIKQAMRSFWNVVGIIATQMGRLFLIVQKANPIMQTGVAVLKKIEEHVQPQSKGIQNWPQFLDDLAVGKFSGRRPDRVEPRAGRD